MMHEHFIDKDFERCVECSERFKKCWYCYLDNYYFITRGSIGKWDSGVKNHICGKQNV